MNIEEIKTELLNDEAFKADLIAEVTIDHPDLFIAAIVERDDQAAKEFKEHFDSLLMDWALNAVARGEFELTY